MNPVTKALFLWCCFLSPAFLRAQENAPAKPQTIFQRIASLDEPQVILRTNIDTLFGNRNTEDYQDADFILQTPDGGEETYHIEIRNRGRSRRRTCDFPPIKLKFENDSLEALGLKKHNELKLVTHCLEENEGEENLRQEYLIYKLYQELSPVHYRAKLVDITYVHTDGSYREKSQAIILEDEKELAERLDSKLCEDCYGSPDSLFDNYRLQILTLYQYMVGNADWLISVLRNVKLLKPDDGGKYLLAPYDFDFTGVVNASYARPDPTIGIANVKQRVLLGPLNDFRKLPEAVAYFKERKGDILAFVEDFPYLRRNEKRSVIRYFESFFDELEDLNTSPASEN